MGRRMISRILICCFALVWLGSAPAAHARIVLTFWSQDMGSHFPHAFFSMRGRLADGRVVDDSYGFTVKTLSPAILLGEVPGRIDRTERDYWMNSEARFETEITEGQLGAVMSLVREWSDQGDSTYDLNDRNCVHFVAEAARRAGLAVEMPDALSKKPKSFLRFVDELNGDRVTTLELDAAEFFARLPSSDAPSAVSAIGGESPD